ncbi:MAG: insulinase family protein [Sandaracinaceae bacterium]|nr:insulinase family protein [Sandaracinaceae bacterium]
MIAPAFRLPGGVPVFLEVSHALPIVDVDVVITRGSILDPVGREGLTRLTARLMRRGPAGVDADVFDERLDRLGATLSLSVGPESMRVQGTVIRRNLPAFLDELAAILRAPALREDDFAKVKRTIESELVQLRDHDASLAARALRRFLFGRHAYGRPAGGTLASVAAITLDDVRACHAARFRAPHAIVGLAGDVRPEEAERLVRDALTELPRGAARRPPVREPRQRPGRRVFLVDKPKRTQSQIYVGTLGMKVAEPDHHAMMVANTAFGGTFTARLMKAVRSDRGWSYGAYSKLGADRQREAWSMWTHPGAEQLVDCLALELQLYERWIDRGLTREEVRRAKRYLVKGHAFDLETASKRLEPKLQTAALELPPDWFERYPERIGAVTRDEANAAVRARLSRDDLTIAVLATATPELRRKLAALPGVREVRVISYADV